MLVPFKGPEATIQENICFNETSSAGRVVIEHVMGLLKMRWQSLRGLPIQVKKKSDLKRVNQV